LCHSIRMSPSGEPTRFEQDMKLDCHRPSICCI
jgi:hypothetical protein